jgi:hypothetical protein
MLAGRDSTHLLQSDSKGTMVDKTEWEGIDEEDGLSSGGGRAL